MYRFLLLLLASCSQQVSPTSVRNDLDHETGNTFHNRDSVVPFALRITKYSNNNCSQVAIGNSTLVDSCHGWQVTDCGRMAFFRGVGVRQDTGLIVYYEKSTKVFDVSVPIDEAISRQFPNYEILHRTFVESSCHTKGMSISMRGSRIRKNKDGEADPLTAIIEIDGAGGIAVTGLR
jgi:hypothetical protein